MARHPDTLITPNAQLAERRAGLPSPRRPGQRMSRTELADAVNTALAQLYPDRDLTAQCVDHRWIGKLERGEHRWPSEERRAALRLVFGAARDTDLGLYSPRRTSAPASADHAREVPNTPSLTDETAEPLAQPQGVTSGDVRRRTVVALGVMAALAGAEQRLPDRTNGKARKIGISDVAPLEHSVRHLYSLDYQIGGGSLWQAAAVKTRDGYSMLKQGSYSHPTESRLLKVTARLEMCTGWLALDAGEHAVARTRFTEALILARQAQDPEVETAALTYLAGQANSLNRPREARRFASSAAQVPTINQHPRLAAIPWLRLAVASSLTGDARASETAITNARRIVDRDSEKPAAEWCSFLSHTEIDGLHGTCELTLSRPARAEKLLDAAVRGYRDGYARNRALYRVRLAHARLLQGEPEGAAYAAKAALDDMVGEVESWRVSTEMAEVSHLFAAHRDVAEVDSFLARYRKT